MGNDPPQFSIFRHGRRSCAATCQITREDGAIIDICEVVLVRLVFFHCMPAGRHSDSTPHSRRVRLCSRLPCGSCSAGNPPAVVCSREFISCGNGGTLRRCLLDSRGHVISACAHGIISPVRLLRIVRF